MTRSEPRICNLSRRNGRSVLLAKGRDVSTLSADNPGRISANRSSRVMGAVHQAQFVTRPVERQRHFIDRLSVEYAARKKPSDRHDTVPAGRPAKAL
jgi:hypothetical protein